MHYTLTAQYKHILSPYDYEIRIHPTRSQTHFMFRPVRTHQWEFSKGRKLSIPTTKNAQQLPASVELSN